MVRVGKLIMVMVVRVGKISISIKNGKYRGNIVSNEKAGIAHPYFHLQISVRTFLMRLEPSPR